jgi:hypothetical protein
MGSGGIDPLFFVSVLVGGERLASRPCRFTPEERAAGTHWTGDWVDTRARLDGTEKLKFLNLPGLEFPSDVQSIASRYTDYRYQFPI